MWREAWHAVMHLLLRGTALGSWRLREHNNADIVILLAVIFNMIAAFPANCTSFSTAYFVQVSVLCQQVSVSSLLTKQR